MPQPLARRTTIGVLPLMEHSYFTATVTIWLNAPPI